MFPTLVILFSLGTWQDEAPVQLHFDTSEAEAVLSILAKQDTGEQISESDWEMLFATEPYRRLKQREAAMQRAFTDESFREFVLSEDLVRRRSDLERALTEWKTRDLSASAQGVLGYLPRGAQIHASVYPVIKPKTNSFVFDPRGNAAIFLYLDPEQSAAVFENTVAHELHHIGFSSVLGQDDPVAAGFPSGVREAVDWMGSFGEGFAMLAAAGDMDTHPHEASPEADRKRWDQDMANFNEDLQRLEAFFLDVIEGRLVGEEAIRQKAFSFFGVQGPWYTVGYRMAVVVERRFGRTVLLECMMDPRKLLSRYNSAAAELNETRAEPWSLWSPRLLQLLNPSE